MKHFESELTKSEQAALTGGVASMSSGATGELAERCTVASCAACKEGCKESCYDGCKESNKGGKLSDSMAITALPMESAATSSVLNLLR